MTTLTTLSPVLQFGFAGVCVILLGMICWLIKLFVATVRQMTRAVQANTTAIIALTGRTEQTDRHLREMRDETLRHGCPFGVRAAAAQPATAGS
jgi:cell division protein FtsB